MQFDAELRDIPHYYKGVIDSQEVQLMVAFLVR